MQNDGGTERSINSTTGSGAIGLSLSRSCLAHVHHFVVTNGSNAHQIRQRDTFDPMFCSSQESSEEQEEYISPDSGIRNEGERGSREAAESPEAAVSPPDARARAGGGKRTKGDGMQEEERKKVCVNYGERERKSRDAIARP